MLLKEKVSWLILILACFFCVWLTGLLRRRLSSISSLWYRLISWSTDVNLLPPIKYTSTNREHEESNDSSIHPSSSPTGFSVVSEEEGELTGTISFRTSILNLCMFSGVRTQSVNVIGSEVEGLVPSRTRKHPGAPVQSTLQSWKVAGFKCDLFFFRVKLILTVSEFLRIGYVTLMKSLKTFAVNQEWVPFLDVRQDIEVTSPESSNLT